MRLQADRRVANTNTAAEKATLTLMDAVPVAVALQPSPLACIGGGVPSCMSPVIPAPAVSHHISLMVSRSRSVLSLYRSISISSNFAQQSRSTIFRCIPHPAACCASRCIRTYLALYPAVSAAHSTVRRISVSHRIPSPPRNGIWPKIHSRSRGGRGSLSLAMRRALTRSEFFYFFFVSRRSPSPHRQHES